MRCRRNGDETLSATILEPIGADLDATEKGIKDLSEMASAPASQPSFVGVLKNFFAPMKPPSTCAEKHDTLQNKVAEVDRKVKYQAKKIKKEDRALASDLIRLRNRNEALWYSLLLLSSVLEHSAIKFEESEQAIRYIVDADLRGREITKSLEGVLRHPIWLLRPIPLLEQEGILNKVLLRIRDISLLSRPAGPRGNVAAAAQVAADKTELLEYLVNKFRQSEGALGGIALLLGEWGGANEAQIIGERLLQSHHGDVAFGRDLISALATIGGADAIDALLQVAEIGSDKLRSAALSGLEYLSSGGSKTLTEMPEIPSLSTPEILQAYRNLAERLDRLCRSNQVDEYTRFKTEQLLRSIIHPALNTTSEVA